LIEYTPTARRHVNDLLVQYRNKQRPEAIRNLRDALARVEATIQAGSARPRDFPATYRELARPGRAWLKDGAYWVAYQTSLPPIIVAVFWAAADLASRYVEAQ
jgi:plasmid stabilization system protein ParE